MSEDYIGFAFPISILTMATSIYMTVAGKFICQRLLKGQLQRSCAPSAQDLCATYEMLQTNEWK